MTIEKSAAIDIKIGVQAETRDAKKLLTALEKIELAQRRIRDGGRLNAPSGLISATMQHEAERLSRQRSIGGGGLQLTPSRMEADDLGKAAARATGPLSAACGWLDKMGELAKNLSQQKLPSMPSGASQGMPPTRGIANTLLQSMKSLFGAVPHLAQGGFAGTGYVPGFPGVSEHEDRVPAYLTKNEFVMPVKPAKKYASVLEAMRTGKDIRFRNFAEGGSVLSKIESYGSATLDKLPASIAGAIRLGTKSLYLPYLLGAKLNHATALELGHTPDQANELVRKTTLANLLAVKGAIAAAGAISPLLGPTVGSAVTSAAGLIPFGSLGYSAMHPVATAKVLGRDVMTPGAMAVAKFFRGQHLADGGYVAHRFGGDNELAFLTGGEAVIPNHIVAQNRPLVDAILHAKHYAGGGIVGGTTGGTLGQMSGYTVQDCRIINWAGIAPYMPKPVVGGMPPAPGTPVAQGVPTVGALIAANPGPAAISAFMFSVEKTTTAANVLGNSFTTTAQKNEQLISEIVPFGDKFRALGEAMDGVTDRIQRSNIQRERTSTTQLAEHQRNMAMNELRGNQNDYNARAFGANSRSITIGRTDFGNTPLGDVMAREQEIRLSASDALVASQRRSVGAAEAERLQRDMTLPLRNRLSESQRQAEQAALRSREAEMRENRSGRSTFGARATGYGASALTGAAIGGTFGSVVPILGTGLGAGVGALFGAGAYGLHHAFGADTAQRDRAGRTRANNLEATAIERFGQSRVELAAQENRLQLAMLETQKYRNEEAKIGVGLMQGELQILKEANDRRRADVSRLGSMDRGEYRAAQRAAEIVRMRGQGGFERLGSDLVNRAAMIDPRMVEEFRRNLGEQRAMQESRGGRVGDAFQRDWAGTSLRDSLTREREMAQTIRQELDSIEQRSQTNLASMLASSLDAQTRIIIAAFAQMNATLEQRLRERGNIAI